MKKNQKSKIVGRTEELGQIGKAVELGRNILIEGAVGVGKTYLIQQILNGRKRAFERVDGDSRYTEQKLTGWFDPPIVLKKRLRSDGIYRRAFGQSDAGRKCALH